MNGIVGKLVLVVSCMVMSCGGGGGGGGGDDSSEEPSVEDFITGAGTVFGPYTKSDGRAPDPNGGPALTTDAGVTVVNGGTKETTLRSPSPFSKMFLSVGGSAGAAALSVQNAEISAVDGFFEITLPSPQTSLTVAITTNQEVPVESFTWIFQAADEAGRVGDRAQVAVAVVKVGTGDLQISVLWDALSDVDLHVIDPSGEEIYFSSPLAASGGMLDLDSNPACSIDGVNNENITWQLGTAPRGHYVVRVNYFAACDQAATNFIVTVNQSGQSSTFNGTLTGPGNGGGLGAGETIVEFDL